MNSLEKYTEEQIIGHNYLRVFKTSIVTGDLEDYESKKLKLSDFSIENGERNIGIECEETDFGILIGIPIEDYNNGYYKSTFFDDVGFDYIAFDIEFKRFHPHYEVIRINPQKKNFGYRIFFTYVNKDSNE